MNPEDFWQTIHPPNSFPAPGPFVDSYPASFADGTQLLLPIRALPDGIHATASLIINQASFTVLAAIAQNLADQLRPYAPDIIIGLPTLGLTLAAAVAQALGHERYIPLGTSRKFWYDPAFSVPLTSITSPGQPKTLFIDPRMRPLLTGRRAVLIDDVISTGASLQAGLDLLALCDCTPAACAAAMLQSDRWTTSLTYPATRIIAALRTPLLTRNPTGQWSPKPDGAPSAPPRTKKPL
jgi:adenine/guanine phosphoribosyltransferase-like PRPP-binding protein